MALKAQQRLIHHLLSRKEEEGFTLVELIVVVMIIGILSSIAIPSFMNAGDKAKQQEASVLVSSYIKAAQAFYLENGTPANNAGDLSQYVKVMGCLNTDPNWCKNAQPPAIPIREVPPENTEWNSPSGYYSCRIFNNIRNLYVTSRSFNPRTNIECGPDGKFWGKGYGVSGCFNYSTGASKIVLSNTRGDIPSLPDC